MERTTEKQAFPGLTLKEEGIVEMKLSKNIEVGFSLNNWAVPIYIEACRPYTDSKSERWAKQVILMLFCFYINLEWY